MSGDEGAAGRRRAKIKSVSTELKRVRLRGIDDLDKKGRPQKPVEVPFLEELAQAHCGRLGLRLHGRIAQLRRLLEDGLHAYADAGNERQSDLVESLLFDGDRYMNARHAASLVAKAQRKMDAEASAQRFETRRDLAFDGFADFLVAWPDEGGDPRPTPPSSCEEPEAAPAGGRVEAPAVVPPEPGGPGDTASGLRPARRRALLAGASVSLAVAALLSWQVMARGDGGEDGHGTNPAARSSHTSAGRAQKEPEPPAGKSSSTQLPTGDDLEVTYGFPGFPSDFFDTYTAAFQEKDLGALKELLARPRIAAAPADPALTKLIEARGYFLSGMKFNISLTSAKGNTVDVVRIRPVNIERDEIPVGAAFLLPSQGGDDVRQMSFDMDSESPIARHPAIGEGPEGAPFFQSSRIVVEGGDEAGEAVAADFSTVASAYTFQVAVEYRVDGESYRQLVPGLDGEPGTFRIAANLCPLPGLKPRLGEDELAALGRLRYKNLRAVDRDNIDQGYSLIAQDPGGHGVGEEGC
ncbi:hypothetical protein [Streptomyces genisteinicus]|uniref:Uncharacterized protein n=1 Tax=Streptomyces genisteinicus TaxID=2768068 RepID=A0A7H0HP90_9ACTN|nr:hypothetical protein [Streptomyces genisteinicus]QNP62356.1 hypothetical protein IAG43_04995 [Streptomyces genisteinicus]